MCRLYLNPPPRTVLISIDEKTGIQAKSRRHPEIPARLGRDARREFGYIRHGSSHTCHATRGWLAAHPRFPVTYTPKHASWLNIIVRHEVACE